MRLTAALVLALAALGALALWATGGFAAAAWWVQAQQRVLQSALTGEVAALRSGDPAALWRLMAICGAYGFLHAVGPGHGKALIAGAALGGRATARRMAAIALAGSLAQALVAVALVYGGLALVGVTARGLTDGANRWVAPLGNLAVALIGALILARGLHGFWPTASRPRPEDRDNRAIAGLDRRHVADRAAGCGHDHGPSFEQAARATGAWGAAPLVGAMAVRPCTGAIVVLVIAWRMGLPVAGAAAVIAMGLGAAAFTALVAWLAVSSRDAAFLTAGSGAFATRLGPLLQIVAGGLLVTTSGLLLLSEILA